MRYAQMLGRLHKGQRLYMVGTIGKKLIKLVFILYFELQAVAGNFEVFRSVGVANFHPRPHPW